MCQRHRHSKQLRRCTRRGHRSAMSLPAKHVPPSRGVAEFMDRVRLSLDRRVHVAPVWCLRNNYTFVALKLAWGEARGRECIPSDTRPTEQRSPRPISAQPEGRHVFCSEAVVLAPYRSTAGYARRSRLASAQNPLPRMYSYFGDTTLAARAACPRGGDVI